MAQQNRDPRDAPREKPQQPREPQAEPGEQEKVQGGASEQPGNKPMQRQPGRMPLPD